METMLSLVATMGVGTSWNKSDLELRLLGDRRIIFRSADNPDRLRGANVGFLWLDEAALMDEDIWPTAIATLRHAPGKAIATTTPRGKNWLYTLWTSGGEDYAVIESATTDNAYLPAHFVSTLRQSMTSEMYAQEVQGQFIDPLGSLFQRHWFRVVPRAPEGLTWARYWDLAASTKQSADYTASVRAALGDDGTLYLDGGIHMKAEWPDVRKVIIATALSEPSTILGIEEAMHGLAAVQELRRMRELASTTLRGIRVDKDKQSRAMPWAARAEAGKVALVAGDWVKPFIDEVVAFPTAAHDDYVDAASGAVAMIAKPKVEWSFS